MGGGPTSRLAWQGSFAIPITSGWTGGIPPPEGTLPGKGRTGAVRSGCGGRLRWPLVLRTTRSTGRIPTGRAGSLPKEGRRRYPDNDGRLRWIARVRRPGKSSRQTRKSHLCLSLSLSLTQNPLLMIWMIRWAGF